MTTDSPTIFIATRGSALALAQARQVQTLCQNAFSDLRFELNVIKTTGDNNQTDPLSQGKLPKGLFTKELEVALLEGRAHLAVHSLKDLPTALPDGLSLGAVLPREDPRDALIVKASLDVSDFSMLPDTLTVATGSPRRQRQLAQLQPKWSFTDMRGNVGTRLRKVADSDQFQATMLAMAGLNRLGYQANSDGSLTGPDVPDGLRLIPIELDLMIPAVGQAAIGLEIADHPVSHDICARLNHEATWRCVLAERAFLHAMGGGCHLALGAYGRMQKNMLELRGVSFLTDQPCSAQLQGPSDNPEDLGKELARELHPD